MAVYGQITGLVVGDALEVDRAAPNIVAAAPLTDAWLMVKAAVADLDSAALISKHITTAAVTGVGQITDNGATSGTGQLVFQMLAADTSTLTARTRYHYGVKVKLSTGNDYTLEYGVCTPLVEIVTSN